MRPATRTTPMAIAVVGAPGTGKTTLVQALRAALQADADTASCTVYEDDGSTQQRHNRDLTLLMGLDLPRHPDTNGPALLQADAQLRHSLHSRAIAYAVVYGSDQARTECALQTIDYHRRRVVSQAPPAASTWHWNCETCSDASCEHRLFSALVGTYDSVRQ